MCVGVNTIESYDGCCTSTSFRQKLSTTLSRPRLAATLAHQPTSDPSPTASLASMPRKGTATVKKVSKYFTSSEEEDDDEDVTPVRTRNGQKRTSSKSSPTKRRVTFGKSDSENVDPAVAREQLKRPNEAQREPDNGADQPRQDSIFKEQSADLANSLFPNEDASPTNDGTDNTQARTKKETPLGRKQPHPIVVSPPLFAQDPSRQEPQGSLARRAANPNLSGPSKPPSQRQPSHPDRPPTNPDGTLDYPPTMIQGGASIPANQQKNMRACMVCSIVRTQQQFTTQGCPNCEEILELAGNPEQVNDCTSQVFEGLISVADTNRSWVARFQRLEGYVAGVYATQVEGILPEDILVAVENAGINYVPRDGSEQEMLGKD
jgi:transcription elongation factor SPT4